MQRREPGILDISCYGFSRNSGRELEQEESEELNRNYGVPIYGSTDMFCNNEVLYKNAFMPESHIRKKHHSIAYHMSRESVASGATTGILICCNRALII